MAQKQKDVRHQQALHMGLGEAIQRLIHVEFMFRQGFGTVPEALLAERQMLLEALNVVPIQVGFDCNSDGVPDTVEIFEHAASTSCCRLVPSPDKSRYSPPPPPVQPPPAPELEFAKPTPKRVKSTSRKAPDEKGAGLLSFFTRKKDSED